MTKLIRDILNALTRFQCMVIVLSTGVNKYMGLTGFSNNIINYKIILNNNYDTYKKIKTVTKRHHQKQYIAIL